MYYKIILTGILPKRRLSVLGGIRTMFSMQLIEAKQATEAPPTMLDSGFTREEAQKLKEQIELRAASRRLRRITTPICPPWDLSPCGAPSAATIA